MSARSVLLTEEQIDKLRHLVAMEEESMDEYEADGLYRDGFTREEHEAEMAALEQALYRALPKP